MTSQAASAATAPAQATARKFFGLDDRFIAPVFITCILAFGQLSFGILDGNAGIIKTGMAILASILTELVLGKLYTGKWPHWASAYISGISVGILVRSPFVWPYVIAAMISITSKYVIRYKGRHLWNPSNLGIVTMLLVAPQFVATLSIQWGNSIYAMIVIWCLGSLIISRLKRFHICLTYVTSFFAFAFLRHLQMHDSYLSEIAPITGPMYQLYIFFMITDPKTTVKGKGFQIFVAFMIALAEHILRMSPNVQIASHAPYFALTLVGPPFYLYDIWRNTRSKPAATVAQGLAAPA